MLGWKRISIVKLCLFVAAVLLSVSSSNIFLQIYDHYILFNLFSFFSFLSLCRCLSLYNFQTNIDYAESFNSVDFFSAVGDNVPKGDAAFMIKYSCLMLSSLITGAVLNNGLESHLPESMPIIHDFLRKAENDHARMILNNPLKQTIGLIILYVHLLSETEFKYSDKIETMSEDDYSACMYILNINEKFIIHIDNFVITNLVLKLETFEEIQTALSKTLNSTKYIDLLKTIFEVCAKIMHAHHAAQSKGHKHTHATPIKQQVEDLLFVLLDGSVQHPLPRNSKAYKLAAAILSKVKVNGSHPEQ